MAVTLRNRATEYDNIAVGSATGTERTIKGSAPPSQTWGNSMDITSGSIYGKENVVVSGTALMTRENVG